MGRLGKKYMFALLSLFSVFVIAACSQDSNNSDSSTTAKTEEMKKTTEIEGEWKLTDIHNSMQSIYSIYKLNVDTFGKLLTTFDDLDMRLKINGDNVEVSYSTDLNRFANDYYEISKQDISVEAFKEKLFPKIKELATPYKTNKVTTDTATGAFTFYAPGTVNSKEKNMTFEEPLNFIMYFPVTFTGPYDPVTYKYELKDNLLIISMDGTEKETHQPAHVELKFERVTGSENNKTNTTTKQTISLDGKWELMNTREALLRGLFYRVNNKNKKAFQLIYLNALKDLKPTLTISGNTATYEVLVNLTDAYNADYDYYYQTTTTEYKDSREKYINFYFNRLKTDLMVSINSKIDIDEASYSVHTVIPNGKVDTNNNTISFPNPMALADFVIFSETSQAYLETIYNYSLEGDILTITFEKPNSNKKYNIYYELKFKKVQN
ncbi:MAG: hypothetical protein Q3964_04635 [Carnobacterium sp.]|nr:hypothetical protein [Carnobacterium sp.]